MKKALIFVLIGTLFALTLSACGITKKSSEDSTNDSAHIAYHVSADPSSAGVSVTFCYKDTDGVTKNRTDTLINPPGDTTSWTGYSVGNWPRSAGIATIEVTNPIAGTFNVTIEKNSSVVASKTSIVSGELMYLTYSVF